MKKIKSIYMIFVVFLIMIIAGFLLLYGYSRISLESLLMETALVQLEHSDSLLDQKVKEIEIEADGILSSDDLKTLHGVINARWDAYDYVTSVNAMKEYLESRQKSNVGMGEFILYWPKKERLVSTLNSSQFDREIFEEIETNKWMIWENEIYFVRCLETDYDRHDDEPYLLIRMDRDFLYGLKGMASGMRGGGTMFLTPDERSFLSVHGVETVLQTAVRPWSESAYKITVRHSDYQILGLSASKCGLRILTYYPIDKMMEPVGRITWIMGISLGILLIVGFVFMVLYNKNILIQLQTITEKLRQVESGDFTTQITELPDNEFSYVFDQFNRMVTRIRELISTTLKEQQLRSQAELRQLQLQINPHFLYNSLSYIVTVAGQPKAVTDMAVHLSRYYRYCTGNKSMATIGEEISYAKSYLQIMAMRKNIDYSLSVPESLYHVKIIPLILQPLIENAIEHGIEGRENARHIYIKVHPWKKQTVRVEISDDGNGLSEEESERLTRRLARKQRVEGESVGLWNVNQRLINYYDESARLNFGKSIWGGLLVSFVFLPGDKIDDSIDCG